MKYFDAFMDSGIMKNLEQAQSYFTTAKNFVQDIVLFVFANLLMDAILMIFHKKFSHQRNIPDDMQVELWEV